MSFDSPTCAVLRSKVPDSWDVLPLADVTDFQEGPGILAKDFTEVGVPLLRLRNMEGARVNLSGSNFLDPRKVEKKWAHFALSEGDFLISTSASLGRVSVVGPEAEGAIAYTGIIRFRSRSKKLNHDYLRAFLSSAAFVEQAEQMATGSVIKHFGPSHLKQMAIVLPSLEEQAQIASIFDVLDHRIALVRETNATLEAIAQALFKSWFVDFDPVRAKMEGRAPGGMDAETAALFPDSLEESKLGLVPKGWSVGTIDQATSLIIDYRGKTPKKLGREWSSSGIPAVSAKNIKRGRLVEKQAMNFVDAELFDLWMKDKLAPGDVLMTSEAPLGELVYLAEDHNFCISQRVFALRANPMNCFPSFLYFSLTSSEIQERLSARATGTTVVGIRQSELRKVEMLFPPLSIQKMANDTLSSCLLKIEKNEALNETLTTLRDTLLPRLISGQLRLSEAADQVKRAA